MANQLTPANLGPEQVAWIIKKFALRTSHSKIKTEFQQFFESSIKGEDIMRIEAQYKDRIAQQEKLELMDIKRNRLAHVRVRLDIIDGLLEQAMTPSVIRSVRISDTEYREIMGVDMRACIDLLKLSKEEELSQKKLFLEKWKLEIDIERESGYVPVEVDTGIDEEVSMLEIDNG